MLQLRLKSTCGTLESIVSSGRKYACTWFNLICNRFRTVWRAQSDTWAVLRWAAGATPRSVSEFCRQEAALGTNVLVFLIFLYKIKAVLVLLNNKVMCVRMNPAPLSCFCFSSVFRWACSSGGWGQTALLSPSWVTFCFCSSVSQLNCESGTLRWAHQIVWSWMPLHIVAVISFGWSIINWMDTNEEQVEERAPPIIKACFRLEPYIYRSLFSCYIFY